MVVGRSLASKSGWNTYHQQSTKRHGLDDFCNKLGNKVINVSSWTINWESANSVTEEKPPAAPGGPIALP